MTSAMTAAGQLSLKPGSLLGYDFTFQEPPEEKHGRFWCAFVRSCSFAGVVVTALPCFAQFARREAEANEIAACP